MLEVNDYNERFSACLLDYLGDRTPWHRRLWSVGVSLATREVLEALTASLSERAFADLCASVGASALGDPGVGDRVQQGCLQRILRGAIRSKGLQESVLRQILDDVDANYLKRWSEHVASAPGAPTRSFERAARAVASHMLDAGFSPSHLHRWFSYHIRHSPHHQTLADLLTEAHELLVGTPARTFPIMVALLSAPRLNGPAPREWRTASEVSEWVRSEGFDTRGLRAQGGMLFEIEARDAHSAVEQVVELVERISARVALGTASRMLPHDHVWVRGEKAPFPLRRSPRRVEIRALAREERLYDLDPGVDTRGVDAALELIEPLDAASPATAVAGAWAAIESLLLSPGETGDRGSTGDRLSAIIASSFPRAELTTLGYAHQKDGQDALACALREQTSSLERATLVAKAIELGTPLVLRRQSDRVAEQRLRALSRNPKQVLDDIKRYVGTAIRRLYRQRNLVLHGGYTRAVCLRAALRTTAPLLGAGFDRIAHSAFVEALPPIELAGRATLRLELLGSCQATPWWDLLKP